MKTHYDVLKLERNCSAKEIKDSFIKLSKQYHPDKNKSSDAHKKFVEVNEAYSVLGKRQTRNSYDETLSYPKERVAYNTYTQNAETPYKHYTEMYSQMRKQREASRSSNSQYFTRSKLAGVLFCCILMFFGSGLQLIAASHRNAVRREELAAMLKARRKVREMGDNHFFIELEKKLKERARQREKSKEE